MSNRAIERDLRAGWFERHKAKYSTRETSYDAMRDDYIKWCQEKGFEPVSTEGLRQWTRKELGVPCKRKTPKYLTAEYLVVTSEGSTITFEDKPSVSDYISKNSGTALKLFKAVNVKIKVEVEVE